VKKLFALAFVLLLLIIVPLRAQEEEHPGYEILSHRAKVQLYPQSNIIACTDTLMLHITDRKISKLEIGLVRIYSLADMVLQGRRKEFKRERDGFMLEQLPPDTLLQLIVVYSGSFSFRSEFSSFTSERAILREEEVFPYGPKAYQFVRTSITVPKEWEAVASGNLLHQLTVNDSTTTVWECATPVPIIGWICAGKFWNKNSETQQPSIALHLFPEDSLLAGNIVSLAGDALEFYGKRFSPYRFSRLSILEVEDWVAGKNVLAVAIPSCILVKKLAFTTKDAFNQVRSVLPHEIAHQWWPMTVFIEQQDAAFLSEGMCEYSALLFNESRGTMGRRDSLGTHPLLRPLLTRVAKGEDLPLEQKADLRSLPTHYLKASYVHNMLRRTIGDSLFSLVYAEYARRFALNQATLKDFRELAEELSGKKLGLFFEQWVKKRGVPRMKLYNVKSAATRNSWTTRGRVRILGYDKYTTFVNVGATTPSGRGKMRVQLGIDSLGVYRNDVPFEIVTNQKPTRVLLDPDGDILKLQKLPVKLGDLRDPSEGVMIVGTHAHREYLIGRARKDSAAMENGGWSISIKYDTNSSLADLQQEKVFLYGNATENSVAADLEKKFPVAFHGDSVMIKGKAVFDSTLTLIQAIESPYINQGIICWIAPLSDQSQSELLPYDSSWTLVRGKDEISSGIWEVNDEDLEVDVK
jgi:hypothetical protein